MAHRFSNTRAQRKAVLYGMGFGMGIPPVVRLRALQCELRMLQADTLIRIIRLTVKEVLSGN